MARSRKLSRRDFLRLSAMAAATMTIAACGGVGSQTSAPTTIPATTAASTVPSVPSTFREAPALAQLVAAGTLPPVGERLPRNPYIPPHAWLTTGKYGGVLNKKYANYWVGLVHEMQYGASPLRWLKDGLAIGPGWVESWESTPDASKWLFKMREGIRWSDGKPFTTKDIEYWWVYTIGGNGKLQEFPAGINPREGPPDELRSGKYTLATVNFVDDYTFELVFDAPAPLTADRMAMWVKGFIGPAWAMPRHYLEEFNPVLNPDQYKDWGMHESKFDVGNPDCPRLTGWKLTRSDASSTVWDRNPYYWAVDNDGNQLPYIDRIVMTALADKDDEKHAYIEGGVDHAQFHAQGLADIEDLRTAEPTSKLQVRLWDSGSGTASMYCFNQDFYDPKYRAAFRDPKFRQALSYAYNRADVQKEVYLGYGEPTTGTLSPKAIEYNINDEGKAAYMAWRDSYLKYDPALAEKLLDEAGYRKGADGKRTFPDGSPMQIPIYYNVEMVLDADHLKNERLVRDWKAIGFDVAAPSGTPYAMWPAGVIPMFAHWEVGDGPNHLVYPQWLVPIDGDHWAPLHGVGYSLHGTAAETEQADLEPWARTPARLTPNDEEFLPAIGDLYTLYDQSKVEPDAMKRHKLVWDMIKIHVAEGPFFSGTIANPPALVLVKEGLMNVPTHDDLLKEGLGGFVNPWIMPCPAVYDPETWYWDDPIAHNV